MASCCHHYYPAAITTALLADTSSSSRCATRRAIGCELWTAALSGEGRRWSARDRLVRGPEDPAAKLRRPPAREGRAFSQRGPSLRFPSMDASLARCPPARHRFWCRCRLVFSRENTGCRLVYSLVDSCLRSGHAAQLESAGSETKSEPADFRSAGFEPMPAVSEKGRHGKVLAL